MRELINPLDALLGATRLTELFSCYQERLRSHAQAFDGLLSLIPAKFYYGEDGSVRPTSISYPLLQKQGLFPVSLWLYRPIHDFMIELY